MSLDAIALEVAESTDAAPEFIVATDARRKEVYWARYTLADAQLPQLLDGPHVGFAADLPDLRSTAPAPGSTPTPSRPSRNSAPASRRPSRWASSPSPGSPRGRQLLDSTPLYLRESDAQVPGPRKRAL